MLQLSEVLMCGNQFNFNLDGKTLFCNKGRFVIDPDFYCISQHAHFCIGSATIFLTTVAAALVSLRQEEFL